LSILSELWDRYKPLSNLASLLKPKAAGMDGIAITENAKVLATNLIKRFEGCRLQAYQDVVGVWTIGYGNTGPDIIQGITWTQDQADAELAKDVHDFMARLAKSLKVQPTDYQMAAMTSLCYNIGIDHFLGSTLLRRFNSGDIKAAAAAFLSWKFAGGQVDKGLLWRREQEQHTFLTPV
jgi:lysozyme